MGRDAWFGKVIVSPRKGYFTRKYATEAEANQAAKELLEKLNKEVKK